MALPPVRPSIGIVTALPIECFAVQAVMSDVEEAQAEHHGDGAVYYVGSVPSRESEHPHSVVLCLLTEDGGVAAAHGCANLQRTWGVSQIVMCGIACGVPAPADPPRHVRLGDVLVAEDGVIPYGHVRVTPQGEELRRPAARPSVRLRDAARRLRTGEEAGLRPWDRLLDLKLNGRGDLAAYARPPESTDVLYDDAGRQTSHPPKAQSGHVGGRPKVHYGLMGSGGKLIRTARERNRLARLHHLIGLDMEGDGVSDAAYLQGVDWFMVRGVSDYGSRKNDRWHRYSALAAASYTHALLGQLGPVRAVAETHRSTSAAGIPRIDLVPSEMDVLIKALLDIRTMRDRHDRDRTLSSLPGGPLDRVSRTGDTYSDVRAAVEKLAVTPGGLPALLEALYAVEGDSVPVLRFAQLIGARREVSEPDQSASE